MGMRPASFLTDDMATVEFKALRVYRGGNQVDGWREANSRAVTVRAARSARGFQPREP